MSDTSNPVCRYCGKPIERRKDDWAHSDPLKRRSLRFWCDVPIAGQLKVEPKAAER